MTAITPFLFEGEALIRVVMIDGEPWFVASDVCKVLELSGDAGQHVRRLDDDEKQKVPGTLIQNQGGPDIWLINESGLYTLILRSDKPAAKRFRKWVTAEVLPSIRKTGTYGLPPTDAETDALPAEDMRSWLKMVSESRMLFGKTAARRLWLSSPLPKVDGMETHAIPTPETAVDLDPLGCWRHLLDWMPRGTERTIAELLADRANPDTVRFLRQRGILPDPKGWDGWIAISNTNRDLARLFAATPWRDNWALALLQLPEARRYPGCIHFDTTTRAVLVKTSEVL